MVSLLTYYHFPYMMLEQEYIQFVILSKLILNPEMNKKLDSDDLWAYLNVQKSNKSNWFLGFRIEHRCVYFWVVAFDTSTFFLKV